MNRYFSDGFSEFMDEGSALVLFFYVSVGALLEEVLVRWLVLAERQGTLWIGVAVAIHLLLHVLLNVRKEKWISRGTILYGSLQAFAGYVLAYSFLRWGFFSTLVGHIAYDMVVILALRVYVPWRRKRTENLDNDLDEEIIYGDYEVKNGPLPAVADGKYEKHALSCIVCRRSMDLVEVATSSTAAYIYTPGGNYEGCRNICAGCWSGMPVHVREGT